MRIDEAFRRVVGGYWWLIALLVILPGAGAAYYGAHQDKQYEAVARIQMSGGLASTNVQADAATQWFLGVVTSPNMVKKAMAAAGIPGDPALFSKSSISVTRVGVSTVNDLSVITSNSDRSVIAANSLVQQALSYANTSHQSDATQMGLLNKQLDALTAQRDRLIRQLATAPPGQVLELQARIAAAAPNLTDLLRQRSDLVLASSQRSSIGLLDAASALPAPVNPKVPQLVALAALVGLLLGLGLAAIAEAVRPRVRGRRWVAAELGAPLLGHLPTVHLTSPDGSRALRDFGIGATMVARRFRGQTVLMLPVEKRYARFAALIADEIESLTGFRIEHTIEAVHQVVDPESGDCGGVVVIALSPSVEVQRNLEELTRRASAMGWPLVGVLTFRRPWLFGRRALAKGGHSPQPAAAASRAADPARVTPAGNQGALINQKTRRLP